MSIDAVLEHKAPGESPEQLASRRRGVIFLCMAVGAVGFAMALQLGLNSNFTAQDLGLSGFQQGVLEGCRESCGILALAILALLAGLAEPAVGAAMLFFLGVGLSAYAGVHRFGWVIVASLIWSQGLHTWMPLPNSMALALAEPGRQGRRLGQLGAAGAAGSAAGLGIAFILHLTGVPLRPLWLLAGLAAFVAAGACLGIPRQIKTERPRLVFRRRYGLYYLLCFLEGWRKQIFIAFAGFLLVKVHGIPLTTMLILWLAIQGGNWLASPVVGRIIDRTGERHVLALYYTLMTGIFLGYAFIPQRWMLCTLFVLDSIFFVMNMGLTTYVSRLAPPAEHTATLSMGVAMNHIAAVTMPLVGGLLWNSFGPRWLFLLGAAVAVVSIGVAWQVPRRERIAAAEAL